MSKISKLWRAAQPYLFISPFFILFAVVAVKLETAARANSMLTQLETAIAKLDSQIAAAQSRGDAAKVASLEEERTGRLALLEQVRKLG